MKLKKFISLLVVLPILFGCKEKAIIKDPLVIPNVDVLNIQINLPTKPIYNEGVIQNDDTYDYLDFYEISDFHGAVYEDGKKIGLSKLATYLNNKRAENPGGTVIVSAGDMFQGSAESNLTHGYVVNYAMNYMGFDAMAVGNHEFDWTTEWLENNSNLKYNDSTIPYLGINILEKSTGKTPVFLKKSTTITRGDYKIGIIGSIGGNLSSSILATNIEAYNIVDELNLISLEADSLKESGCDIVILLDHQGFDSLPHISNVDAIFGGHAHENISGMIGEVPAAATKNYGQGIAHIELKINKDTKQVSLSGTPEVDATTADSVSSLSENADVKNIISQYETDINKIKSIRLGHCDSDLIVENELKNLCVQSMMESAKECAASVDIDSSKIIASFHNVSGGIRDNIKAGEITYGSVYNPFPFDNELVFYKAKGTFLKKKLGNLTDLAVCKTVSKTSDLDDNTYYYLVLTDFIALSTNFFKSPNFNPEMSEDKLIKTGVCIRDTIVKYIYQLDEIKLSDFSTSLDKFKSFN